VFIIAELEGGSTSGGYPIVTKKDVPIKVTVSTTAPQNPSINDIWIDIST